MLMIADLEKLYLVVENPKKTFPCSLQSTAINEYHIQGLVLRDSFFKGSKYLILSSNASWFSTLFQKNTKSKFGWKLFFFF